MLINILREIICQTFEEECHSHERPNKKALRIVWNHFDSKIDDYPKTEMIVHGEYNYVGVYVRKYCVHGTLTGEEEFKCLSYHDSCWKTDGVERWLFLNEKSLSTIGELFKNWYSVIELSDEQMLLFKNLRRR